MNRRVHGWMLLVLAVLVSEVVMLTQASLRAPLLGGVVFLLDLIGAVASFRAARRDDAAVWRLIAAGRVCSMFTSVAWAASLSTGIEALWWIGVPARLGVFVCLAFAVLFAPARRLDGRRRIAFTAEALTVLAGGFMVVWYFVINPGIDGTRPSADWIGEIGYPIGDLLMLMAIAVSLLRGTIGRPTGPMGVLIAGMGVYLVGDATWSSVQLSGVQAMESPLPGLLMVNGALLLTVAAMRACREPSLPPSPAVTGRTTSWSARLPFAAMLVGGTLMVVVTIAENDMLPWGGLVLGMITMTAAIATRQVISLRDSRDQIVTDPLTGLANRTGLDEAIVRWQRRPTALLLIDLDGFKPINDVYGHSTGDIFLSEFAHHLRSAVRAGDLAARLGGDEFVVLLPDVTTDEDAAAIAQRILAITAASPVRIGEDTVPIQASIGITLGDPGDSAKEMLRRADVAMYQVKRAGTHGWVAYDAGMVDRRAEDAALSEDLRSALSRGELHVRYQPIVDLADGRTLAVEALLRWTHPVQGAVSPVRFIPIAERTGVINEIGLYVLEESCRQVASWDDRLYLSVNLSPRQLQNPALIHDVMSVLRRTGVDPARLVLEVTESAIVDETAIGVLATFRDNGIRIAVDDFGTGYSSLQYLTRLPVDILKIDRSFVAQLDGTSEGSAITQAVIRLSQVLHLNVVAEGIETPAQAAELRALGCIVGQGFLYSPPMPPAELGAALTVAA